MRWDGLGPKAPNEIILDVVGVVLDFETNIVSCDVLFEWVRCEYLYMAPKVKMRRPKGNKGIITSIEV